MTILDMTPSPFYIFLNCCFKEFYLPPLAPRDPPPTALCTHPRRPPACISVEGVDGRGQQQATTHISSPSPLARPLHAHAHARATHPRSADPRSHGPSNTRWQTPQASPLGCCTPPHPARTQREAAERLWWGGQALECRRRTWSCGSPSFTRPSKSYYCGSQWHPYLLPSPSQWTQLVELKVR